MTNPNHTDTSRRGDLVKRLREDDYNWHNGACLEAADCIEADGKHIAELDGRAMEYLLLSDKQAMRIAKLEAALTLCANHIDWIPHPHCVEVEAAIRAALGEKQ